MVTIVMMSRIVSVWGETASKHCVYFLHSESTGQFWEVVGDAMLNMGHHIGNVQAMILRVMNTANVCLQVFQKISLECTTCCLSTQCNSPKSEDPVTLYTSGWFFG